MGDQRRAGSRETLRQGRDYSEAGYDAGYPTSLNRAHPRCDPDMPTRVRHFRQILTWPLQLMPIRIGDTVHEAWDVLEHTEGDHPWRASRD